MSPSVGANWCKDARADTLPLLTRGLLTLSAFVLLRESARASAEPSLTVGLVPRFCFRSFVMQALAPDLASVSAARRIFRKCRHHCPSHVDCCWLPPESQGSVHARQAVPTVPSSQSPDQRTSKS